MTGFTAGKTKKYKKEALFVTVKIYYKRLYFRQHPNKDSLYMIYKCPRLYLLKILKSAVLKLRIGLYHGSEVFLKCV